MAQRSHVPKFGNWDGDNVPYTVFFENARKEKSNGVMINPNDPEQNPEAFNFGGPAGGISSDSQERTIPEKQDHHRITSDQQKGTSYGTHSHLSSESSSTEKNSSSSISSIFKPNHKRPDRNKHAVDNNVFPSPAGHHKMNSDDISYRSVSVPKFGEWDEKDPRSAEGFTIIFNKVKEEKHIAASKFPPVPPQPMEDDNNQQARKRRPGLRDVVDCFEEQNVDCFEEKLASEPHFGCFSIGGS